MFLAYFFYMFHYSKSKTLNTKRLWKVEIKLGCNHLQRICVYQQQFYKVVPGAPVVMLNQTGEPRPILAPSIPVNESITCYQLIFLSVECLSLLLHLSGLFWNMLWEFGMTHFNSLMTLWVFIYFFLFLLHYCWKQLSAAAADSENRNNVCRVCRPDTAIWLVKEGKRSVWVCEFSFIRSLCTFK